MWGDSFKAFLEWRRLNPDVPSTVWNGCSCDFCTGKKRYEDNWCAYCAEVQLPPSKHWENLDVCEECEKTLTAERAAEARCT